MTELRDPGKSSDPVLFCFRRVSSESEHSERAIRLFLRGKLLSVIMEMDVGGDTEGGGVKEGSDDEGVTRQPPYISGLRDGVLRGVGGPYVARSSASKVFTREGVTGYRGFLLISETLCLAVLGENVSILGGSPGQIVFIEGRMNSESIRFLGVAREIREE